MKGVPSGVVKVALAVTVLFLGVVVITEVQWEIDGTPPLAYGDAGTDPAGLYDTDPWFRSAWVRGCVGSGESAGFCRCAVTVYTTQLAPWELETASAVARSEGQLAELPEHVRNVVKHVERTCR